VVAIILQI